MTNDHISQAEPRRKIADDQRAEKSGSEAFERWICGRGYGAQQGQKGW
jgi:hypothetical protein